MVAIRAKRNTQMEDIYTILVVATRHRATLDSRPEREKGNSKSYQQRNSTEPPRISQTTDD
jgi:hypothetical protein